MGLGCCRAIPSELLRPSLVSRAALRGVAPVGRLHLTQTPVVNFNGACHRVHIGGGARYSSGLRAPEAPKAALGIVAASERRRRPRRRS
eukprot:scaffold590_cov172-Isochrysis_galbana.AAC.1